MGNRSYPKLVDGLESADDDGSVQGANRAISASLTADSIQKEPGKFVERTAWLFVIISCLDGLDSDLLFQLIKFFNYLHTFLDKPCTTAASSQTSAFSLFQFDQSVRLPSHELIFPRFMPLWL